VFELPQGAVSLASSELTPCQGFRYGKNAYGFLFHMEVTEKIIQNMAREFSEELDEENIEAETIIQRTRDHHQSLQAIGTKVFRRWTKLIKF
jgi:GMP synthase (glutamine-hydrolysing)